MKYIKVIPFFVFDQK